MNERISYNQPHYKKSNSLQFQELHHKQATLSLYYLIKMQECLKSGKKQFLNQSMKLQISLLHSLQKLKYSSLFFLIILFGLENNYFHQSHNDTILVFDFFYFLGIHSIFPENILLLKTIFSISIHQINKSGSFRRAALWMDDLFYGAKPEKRETPAWVDVPKQER